MRRRFSLIQAGIGARLAIAGAASLLIWVAVVLVIY
jgi:hypothetical protein